jgi:exodeoxyribonuclease V beta subunit
MSEILNPLTLPLRGSQLIEASAGTGKTWTIAAVYLRLILGSGEGASAPSRPMLPGEILVMTFTKAATRELSARIRERLLEAAACFRGEAAPHADDRYLTQLLEAYPEGSERQGGAWRLAMAAQAMDDAAVFTIDAWCQRMLREHAFDSGCLFDEELQANQTAMLAQAVHDYWRQQVYGLSDAALEVALGQWKDVDALVRDVRALLEMPLPDGAGQGTLAERLTQFIEGRAQRLVELKQGWAERADRMLAWLESKWSLKPRPINGTKLGRAHCTRWLKGVRAWAQDPHLEIPNVGTGAQRLTPAGVAEAIKPDAKLDVPEDFAAFETMMTALGNLPEVGPMLRAHAAAHVAERMQFLKTQVSAYGFADMLERLNAALIESVHGEKAQRLRQRIIEQYPVALIDEFQDTSPVQLSIFDRLYRIESNDSAQALLLIGDPKQSIYGFRGADIYSYLGARRAMQGRHHVLGVNYRSTKALVEAVNEIFGSAEARDGEGAFMFRPAASGPGSGPQVADADAGLPFVSVDAKGRKERLVVTEGVVPAVTMCLDAQLRDKTSSQELYGELCAERIVTLLNDKGAGFERTERTERSDRAEQGLKRLRPADIAVLVRTGREAGEVRRALRRRGVASVYLSDKDTVFETVEASDLLRLLQAVAAPRDVRLARAALATRMLGLTLEDLVALSEQDELFDQHCESLRQLGVTWQTQGVLAMLRRALHRFAIPAHLLAPGDAVASPRLGEGERRLTNLLHLAELLQGASAQLDGEQALIRWLTAQIEASQAGQGGGEEQVLRLESDADLVQVVTVHKSKGLEYPLVFLPFPTHFRRVERRYTSFVLLPQETGDRRLILTPTDEDLEASDKERQREDLRLLYVALTRARHSLWVGVAALRRGRSGPCVWHQSAIGYLLSGAGERTPPQIADDVQELAKRCPEIAVQSLELGDELPRPAVTRLVAREAPPPLVNAPVYAAQFERNWAISSYSALVRDAAHSAPADTIARVVRDDEPADESLEARDPRRPSEQPWHRFPRGAFAGNFLHGLLEWLAGEGFSLDASEPLRQGLLRRCERQGWGHRGEDVSEWLRAVCTVPLPVLSVAGVAGSTEAASLATLTTVIAELEFWLPSDGLRTGEVDRLCREHVLGRRARPELPERALRGMLMGFSDLVFEHGGKYWVLDYKSNALGTRDADYTQEAMEVAMLANRYDVQAVLYLLALHRLLKLRLGAKYSPAQHLGGAIYFFLRGVRSSSGGCLIVAPPIELIDALDAMITADTAIAEGAR